MIVIRLTAVDAARVRGASASGPGAIEPREIGVDQYILSVAVLTDPVHAAHHDFLAELPKIDWIPPVDDVA